MEYIFKKLHIQELEKYEIAIPISLSILIPIIFKGDQIVQGSIINFLIIFSTLRYGFKKSTLIYLLPSLSTLLLGYISGGMSNFLPYMIPFIMVGNSIEGYFTYRWKKYPLSLFGVLVKSSILLTISLWYISKLGFPNILVNSMGYIQVITGIIGCTLAFILNNILNRKRDI